MKRTILGILIFSLNFSCKRENQVPKKETKDIQVEQLEESISKRRENIISKNIGKYAREINFFDKNDISARLKKLTGAITYKEIVEKFNVQSPIKTENNIYMLTGCLKHNCSGFLVTILYNSDTDNLNVLIEKNGKIIEFTEKEKIHLTEKLKRK